MDKNYVIERVNSIAFKMFQETLLEEEASNLADSILFDWNEIGDAEGDFEALVEWNVDQYFTHNNVSGNDKLKRIKFYESKKFIPYPPDWIEQPTKPRPKFFYLRTLENGWDEVKYFLDKKINLKNYGKKLVEQLAV